MRNGRCRMHGGSTPGGLASPHTQHGRYSKYLPARLAERYHEAQADGELLALREDIALVDARLADVIGRVDSGEAGRLWVEAREAYSEWKRAERASDDARQASAAEKLEAALGLGVQDYQAWTEALDLVERRRRLVESERRRLVEMQQMLTAEQAMLWLAAVSATIRRHVTNPVQLAAIAADLDHLTHAPALDRAPAGGGPARADG